MSNIQGLGRLLGKLEALGGNSERALKTGILQAAKQVQGDAKQFCPVDDGLLRNSIQARVETQAGKMIGIVSTNVEYAPYVEFGTGQRGEESPAPPKYDGDLNYRLDWKGMPAQPFLFPAAEQNKEKVPEIVAKHIRKEIRRLSGP